ncbi:MAG: hypothetical protein R3Y51_00215 [Rikenellaceae bacterium]
MKHILFLIITFTISCKVFAQNNDSVFLKGRVVLFETKEASASFVAFYKDLELGLNTKLSHAEIDDSLVVALLNTDKNGDFKIKLPKGDYIMRIFSAISLDITQKVSLKDSIVDLGIYDPFSSSYYLDEAPAMTALRRRVYNRIMMYRQNGNPTKFNVISEEEVKCDTTKLTVVYEDFNSDSDIKAYYTSGLVVFKEESNGNRQDSRKKMQKYITKMTKKYSKLEKAHFKEAVLKEK